MTATAHDCGDGGDRGDGGLTVRYFATVRDLTGEAERRVAAAPDTLGELLAQLADDYGAAFRAALLDGDSLRHGVIALIDGHNALFDGGTAAPLRGAAELAIFPPIGGG